jgi:hypothetical protein
MWEWPEVSRFMQSVSSSSLWSMSSIFRSLCQVRAEPKDECTKVLQVLTYYCVEMDVF